MEKRRLSAIPREQAPRDMAEQAAALVGIEHTVTARLVEDGKILLLNFYEVSKLKQGKTGAAFRTFVSEDDYITQDLSVSKVRWKTASFENMKGFRLFSCEWNSERKDYDYEEKVRIWSEEDLGIINGFFSGYLSPKHRYDPWTAIYRFQQKTMDAKLAVRHKKETDPIDARMAAVQEAPEGFFDWAFEEAMGFSRYLIYEEVLKNTAKCECTHCGKSGLVSRKDIRMRNNEKGECPFCGSKVTFKARGRMPHRISDERYVAYIDRTEGGFIWRGFQVYRSIYKAPEYSIDKKRVDQRIYENYRAFYTFSNNTASCDAYEYTEYKQTGNIRWCHDEGKINCALSILYPGNLPGAWEHTPMKYSSLELLSKNLPTTAMRYENGIEAYQKYPFLEWMIKMGLYKIAQGVMERSWSGETGKLNCSGKTIYQILGLDKVNTRTLQEIDGCYDELRLLQVAQSIRIQLKPEQLREYYEAFGCNTDFLRQSNRKVSLHKLTKYITKESENYPIGDAGGCWKYSYMRLKEREDPRIERKRNTASDWLEYLGWCREMKYDLDNMFIYMPKNFKKVHDRTAKEYQAFKDAQARKKQEELDRKIKKILKLVADMPSVRMQANGLMVVLPKNSEDLKAEGRTLHHCVGTYAEKVAKGETMILFIRRIEAPEEPFSTLEYRDGKVIQCRGRNNCPMSKEVKIFVKAFEEKVAQGTEDGTAGKRKRKAG